MKITTRKQIMAFVKSLLNFAFITKLPAHLKSILFMKCKCTLHLTVDWFAILQQCEYKVIFRIL